MSGNTQSIRDRLDESMGLISRSRSVLSCLAQATDDVEIGKLWDVVSTVSEILDRAYNINDQISGDLVRGKL